MIRVEKPYIFSVIFILLGLAFLQFSNVKLNIVAGSRTIIVPDDYQMIQSAVNYANAGDTVFVRNGTYVENVVVNKSLTIIGENSSCTVVDGSNAGSVFTVSATGVRIAGFTFQNSGRGYPNSGIRVLDSKICVLEDSIMANNYVGLLLSSSYSIVVERVQVYNAQYGIYLLNSPGNRILDSNISRNYAGFVMFSSSTCQIVANDFHNNTVAIQMSSCSGNRIYYNNFIQNSVQIQMISEIYGNTWDNDYPSGGNYWSNYPGIDLYKGPFQNITGSDGIGDAPHFLKENNQDRFPFMKQISVMHDVAVLSLVPSAAKVYQGQVLNITALAANFGNYTESFTLTVSFFDGPSQIVVGTRTVANLTINTQITIDFVYDTSGAPPGTYTLKAEASGIEGEEYLSNNVLHNGTVTISKLLHDVAVLSVVPSAAKVYQGQVLNISVGVANVGSYSETFNVALYSDDSIIGQKTVASLNPGNGLTLVYSWNTGSVAPDREYVIKAEASGIVGEDVLDNNVYVDGSVKVRSLPIGTIKILELVPSDHLGNPASSFARGAISYCKVVVNSSSADPEVVLVTVNVYDSSSASLGVVSFKGLIMPGTSVFILGLPISNMAHTGTATVYANTLTDWPFAGGLSYGPEKSAIFQILG